MNLEQVDGALEAVGARERRRLRNLLGLIAQGSRGDAKGYRALLKELG